MVHRSVALIISINIPGYIAIMTAESLKTLRHPTPIF
jgi:hypothetical protein